MEEGHLIPANTKKSTLILGFMRIIDVIIISVGIVITVLLLVILENTNNTLVTLAACLPAIICGLLVLPIPNYHNTLVALQSILRYYNERRNYIWRGWCIYDEFKDDK